MHELGVEVKVDGVDKVLGLASAVLLELVPFLVLNLVEALLLEFILLLVAVIAVLIPFELVLVLVLLTGALSIEPSAVQSVGLLRDVEQMLNLDIVLLKLEFDLVILEGVFNTAPFELDRSVVEFLDTVDLELLFEMIFLELLLVRLEVVRLMNSPLFIIEPLFRVRWSRLSRLVSKLFANLSSL